jgi:hypothetical protein
MKLTDKQINWLIKHVDVIEINLNDFDELHTPEHDVTNKPDDTVVWSASSECEGLVFEEDITLSDLRHGTIEDDTLVTSDNRALRFKWTRVIAWEELDRCAS